MDDRYIRRRGLMYALFREGNSNLVWEKDRLRVLGGRKKVIIKLRDNE